MSNTKDSKSQMKDDKKPAGFADDFLEGAIDGDDFADRHDNSPTAPAPNGDAEAFDPEFMFPAATSAPKSVAPVPPAAATPVSESPEREIARKPRPARKPGSEGQAEQPSDAEKRLEEYREKVANLPKELSGHAHNGLRGVNPERVILEHCEPVLRELVKSDLERKADYQAMMRKLDELISTQKEASRSFDEGTATYRAASEQVVKAASALGKQTAEQFKLIRQDTNANRLTNDQNNTRLSALVNAMEGIHKGVKDLTEKKIKELFDLMEKAISSFLGQTTGEAVVKYGFSAACLAGGALFGAALYHWGYAG
jgi:hypothetical protein